MGAQSKFSQTIDRATTEGPQTITRKGRTAAVVVGAEAWLRKTKRVGNLAEFLAASPRRGSQGQRVDFLLTQLHLCSHLHGGGGMRLRCYHSTGSVAFSI